MNKAAQEAAPNTAAGRRMMRSSSPNGTNQDDTTK